MSRPMSWEARRQFVHERANDCCEYCFTSKKIIAQPMHIDHIIPNGDDALENLCLTCANCNQSEYKATTGFDPITNLHFPLFNPRQQDWTEHFAWAAGYTYIVGLTPVGRATVERLKMNRSDVVGARAFWSTKAWPPNRRAEP